MTILETLKIGGQSFLAIWNSYEKLRVFIEQDQYTVALEAIGDVTTVAALKCLKRAHRLEKPFEDIQQAIGYLQLAVEARIKAFEKIEFRERFPFIAEKLVYPQKAKALRDVFQISLLIAVLYRYLGKKTHSNDFLEHARSCLISSEPGRKSHIRWLAFNDFNTRENHFDGIGIAAHELEALKWDRHDLTAEEIEILRFYSGAEFMIMHGQFQSKAAFMINNEIMKRFGLVASWGGNGGPIFVEPGEINFEKLFAPNWKTMLVKLWRGGFIEEINRHSYVTVFHVQNLSPTNIKITRKGAAALSENP
jgi:hypothetical protein